MFAFAKNEQSNISADQLLVIKELAAKSLGWNEMELREAVADGRIEEISDGKQG